MTSPARPRIFLSYRRADSAGHAGRLYDALLARCPEFELFMDVESTDYGLDFTQVLAGELERCHIVIVLIGLQWAHATDRQGRRRLDSPSDYVRQEVEAVLQRGIRVVPVLVQGAEMPSAEDLPESLGPLTLRHAIELSDKRWQYDVEQLVSALRRSLDTEPSPGEVSSSHSASISSHDETLAEPDAPRTLLRAPLKETLARLATLPTAPGGANDDDAYLTLEAIGLADHGRPTDFGRSYLDSVSRGDKSRPAETLRSLLSTHDHIVTFLAEIADDTSCPSDAAQEMMARLIGVAEPPSARRWLEWLLCAELLAWNGDQLGLTEDGQALAREARRAV